MHDTEMPDAPALVSDVDGALRRSAHKGDPRGIELIQEDDGGLGGRIQGREDHVSLDFEVRSQSLLQRHLVVSAEPHRSHQQLTSKQS